MAKYKIYKVDRNKKEAELLEIITAKKIEEARVYASHKYIRFITDFMNTAVVVKRA